MHREYSNPRQLKTGIKLTFFMLTDIFMLFGIILLVNNISMSFPLKSKIFMYIASVLMFFFLRISPSGQPHIKNIQLLVRLLSMDRNRYLPVSVEEDTDEN